MDAPIVDLAVAGGLARAVVGGKGGVLGELLAAGFPVPAGFVVTAPAAGPVADLADALAAAADLAGPGPFAVRSSAAAEDLPEASYAGLYESLLNVPREGLADAIARVVSAAGDPRVAAYRPGDAGPDVAGRPDARAVAVLVQQMVDAAAAGVAFTADPVTGARDVTLVTAVRGLGDRLVGGEAVGEEWRVRDHRTERSRADGGPVLDESEAAAIAALARRVAEHYGAPQDIEWALDAHRRVCLVQARPMTAVPDPVAWTPPGPGLWMRNFRLGEWLGEAMTPLFATWLVPALEDGYLAGVRADIGAAVPFRWAAVNGWYYNATPIPSPALLARVVAASRGRAPWLLYNALVRVSRDPAGADRAVLGRLAHAWRQELLPRYRRQVTAAEDEVVAAPPERLLAMVNELGGTAGVYLWSLAIVGGSAWKMEAALTRFARRHVTAVPAVVDDPQVLLRGLPGTAPGAVPPHAVLTLDWFRPTAGETDGTGGKGSVEPASPGRHAELADARRTAEQSCRAALAGRSRLLARFDQLLQVAQRYTVLREQQARDLTLAWPALRRCLLRLGAELQSRGQLADAADVFFLTRDELTIGLADPAAALTEAAAHRELTWQRQRRLPAPLTLGRRPRLIGDPIARAVDAARAGGELPPGAIVGQPASSGRATGPVRLITGPADFAAFAAGEVLLAATTAPAYTPLFARAAAVVTDGGTLAAHASLIAREYGIPAVVGTGDATRRLRTGQLVTVDGGAGTVTPAHASRTA